jgi:hypothetical protein
MWRMRGATQLQKLLNLVLSLEHPALTTYPLTR